MRLLFLRVLAADACGEVIGEREFPELATNPGAVSATHDPEIEFCRKLMQYAPGPGKQRWLFEFVGLGPQAIGLQPFRAWELRCAIDPQPVRRVMLRDFP